jgi:hypothetical protein
MNKLKIALDDVNAGWAQLSMSDGEQNVSITVSFIYDGFTMLTNVLYGLPFEQGEKTVTWLGEPEEYDMRFVRSGETMDLEVREFPNHLRGFSQGILLFSFTGNYNQVCIPFWRALRSLQGRFSEQELEERWKRPFPHRELNNLTAAIKKRGKAFQQAS